MRGLGLMADAERPLAATLSSEFGTVAIPFEGSIIFGRGADADVRVGAAPVYDDIVPRMAGRVFAVDGRIIVENLDDQLAFDLRVEQRPLIAVPPGDWHSPRDRTFDIIVAGGVTSYELAIRVNVEGVRPTRVPRDADEAALDPPTGAVPTLTDRQRAILDAYIGPLRNGGLVASHQQVAELMCVSRSLVRVECERIWSALFLAGVPMRDLGDARDEIVDAWSRHRI